jgi:hypothetical protein
VTELFVVVALLLVGAVVGAVLSFIMHFSFLMWPSSFVLVIIDAVGGHVAQRRNKTLHLVGKTIIAFLIVINNA